MCIQTDEITLRISLYSGVAINLFGLQLAVCVTGLVGGEFFFSQPGDRSLVLKCLPYMYEWFQA